MTLTDLDSTILFEDDSLLVINKPARWVVNTSNTYRGLTVQEWFKKKITNIQHPISNEKTEYGTPEEIFAQRGGVVHRLDKDTSGVLLLAKTPEILMELLRQFKAREVKKTYLALVHGKMIPSEGVIRLPMGRSDRDHKKFAVSVAGKMSETEYKLLEYYPGLPAGIYQKKGKSYQGFSLLELAPKTGRTHQIRVHVNAIKHPLVGDSTYAGHKRLAIDREWCPRQFLHAKSIEFIHPVTKEKVRFEAELPSDLQEVMAKLNV